MDIPEDLFGFGYDDPGLLDQRYPSLVLAAREKVPTNGSDWYLAYQDCGGFACDVESAAILPLQIKPGVLSALTNIVDEEFAGEGGLDYFGVEEEKTIAEIQQRYHDAVQHIGLTCGKELIKDLTQALYPVDATEGNLVTLTETFVNLSDYEKECELVIYIVGDNCD